MPINLKRGGRPRLPGPSVFTGRKDCDARELLELAADIPIRTDVTVHPLEEANEVLRAMKESRFTGGAVLRP